MTSWERMNECLITHVLQQNNITVICMKVHETFDNENISDIINMEIPK